MVASAYMMMGHSCTPNILLSTCKDQGILHVRVLCVDVSVVWVY